MGASYINSSGQVYANHSAERIEEASRNPDEMASLENQIRINQG